MNDPTEQAFRTNPKRQETTMTNNRDAQDQADTIRQQAESIRVLTDLGFDKRRVVQAVTTGDLSALADA